MSYHGTNAVCGCWSECVVVGIGSIYSSITTEITEKTEHMVLMTSISTYKSYPITQIFKVVEPREVWNIPWVDGELNHSRN